MATTQVIELERIDDTVVGEWQEVSDSSGGPHFIRLQTDGAFLQGTRESFGLYPSTWRAARLHLIQRESLIVDQPGYGTCAFYVRLMMRPGQPLMMHWRSDVMDPTIGSWKDVFGSPVTENFCPERTWQRLDD